MTESDQPTQLNGANTLLPEAKFQQLIGIKQDAAKLADEKYGDFMVVNESGEDIHLLSNPKEGANVLADQENLVKLAKDHLTKLDNREVWNSNAINLVKSFLRVKDPHQYLTLTLMDLDLFKEINDKYGHSAGDIVLAKIGKKLKQEFRDTDILGRYGGDELIQIGISNLENPTNINQEFHKKHQIISNQPIHTHDGQKITATQSWGLTVFSRYYLKSIMNNISSPQQHQDDDYQQLLTTMIDCSDKALYRSKHQGRNQLNIFIEDETWVI